MSTITTWNPYQELERIQDRVFRAIRSANGEYDHEGSDLPTPADWSPSVEISEDDKQYSISADLPQVYRDDVKVVVENDKLIVSGERKQLETTEGTKVHRTERRYGMFRRTFNLPDDADPEAVNASFKDGVLTVTVAKSEAKKPKNIEVRVD
ncbi:MAG: Hsp20/alpha crystallin family protein [Luteolibacter sp.]